MSFKNVRPGAPPRRSSFRSRLASEVLIRLLSNAPRALTQSAPPAPRQPVVAVKKSAVCRDARGGLRRIDLFLPADLVGELSRPIDILFLDGDEPVTADELGRAVKSNFVKVGGGSV